MKAKLSHNRLSVNIPPEDYEKIKKSLAEAKQNELCAGCRFKSKCPFAFKPTDFEASYCQKFNKSTASRELSTFDIAGKPFQVYPNRHFASFPGSNN